MAPSRVFLILIALAAAAFAAACSPTTCNCPFEGTGAAWCDPPATSGCFCSKSVLCPGFCLPDAGGDPVHCDGG